MLLAPSGKGRKRQKKGDFGRFQPISRKGGQTPRSGGFQFWVAPLWFGCRSCMRRFERFRFSVPMDPLRKRFVSASILPDPPILAFLEKARVFPQKSKGFSLCGTPKILGKERKNAQKSKENRKTKKARKSKKARIGGSGLF